MPAGPMEKRYDRALVWFRRDLRAHDHAALYQALTQSRAVHCVFVFDREILDPLPRRDRRVEFIRDCVQELLESLERLGGGLIVVHGHARDEIPRLAAHLRVQVVLCNRDYEPAALDRDTAVARALDGQGIEFHTRKDQVVFETDEVLTQDGHPFSAFTAYQNAWLRRFRPAHVKPYPIEAVARSLAPSTGRSVPR
jgi:deoxyribodipyrimidine photo-lyase